MSTRCRPHVAVAQAARRSRGGGDAQGNDRHGAIDEDNHVRADSAVERGHQGADKSGEVSHGRSTQLPSARAFGENGPQSEAEDQTGLRAGATAIIGATAYVVRCTPDYGGRFLAEAMISSWLRPLLYCVNY